MMRKGFFFLKPIWIGSFKVGAKVAQTNLKENNHTSNESNRGRGMTGGME